MHAFGERGVTTVIHHCIPRAVERKAGMATVDGIAHQKIEPGDAARELFGFLERSHWNGAALEGPDPGIRFNARLWRFAKSYLSLILLDDALIYQQAQGYWTFANWMMWRSSGAEHHRDLAVATSEGVLACQTPEGYWHYPNPEWRGRIATVEGSFAALGLLESYREIGDERYLEGAVRWHRFMERDIGYRKQPDPSMLAINYFQHGSEHSGGVPHNSTLVLWLLARLWEETADRAFLDRAPYLVQWLYHVQMDNGELPYRLGRDLDDVTVHFLCHQYNAFEFMDLLHYRRITGDEAIAGVIERLAGFLATGVTPDVHTAYDCNDRRTTVLYYDLALAQALHQATELGLGDHRATVSEMYRGSIAQQRPNGGFSYHSKRNYGVLSDKRAYPRYLSMMLVHLLTAHGQGILAGGAGSP